MEPIKLTTDSQIMRVFANLSIERPDLTLEQVVAVAKERDKRFLKQLESK